MKSIKKLVQEHDNILMFTAVLESASARLLTHDNIDTADWLDMIHFGRMYADKLHHQKEENILFQEMVNTLGEAAKKLVINGMLVEHDLGRLYSQQLEAAIKVLEGDAQNTAAKLDVIGNAIAYRDLLKRHIDKENDVVYPYAERHFTPEIREKVEQESAHEEAKAENIALEQAQLQTLARLQKIYL